MSGLISIPSLRRLARAGIGVLAIAMAVGAVLRASPAYSCGYHNPADVAVGILNWVYPKALYVRTAVWQAQDAGVLPKRKAKPRDLFAYQRMASRLQTLGQMLDRGASDDAPPSFSAVLIDSVLWSRFVPAEHGYRVEVHAKGPRQGDVVIVTDGRVVRALAEGSLDGASAETHGLIRYYGSAKGQQELRSLFVRALAAHAAPKSEFASAADRTPGE